MLNMIIAYLYNRSVSEGEAMECEKVFADYPATRRAELFDMIERGGLRDGDILRVRAKSDLGKGAEAKRIADKIEAQGVTIEVLPTLKKKVVRGRPARLIPTSEQKEHLCSLWRSPAPQSHVLERAAEIMGGAVNRNHMNYWCGPRAGKKKKK